MQEGQQNDQNEQRCLPKRGFCNQCLKRWSSRCTAQAESGAATDARRSRVAPVPPSLDSRANHRLARQLPTTGHTLGSLRNHLPSVLSYRLPHDRLTEGCAIASSRSWNPRSAPTQVPFQESGDRFEQNPNLPPISRGHRVKAIHPNGSARGGNPHSGQTAAATNWFLATDIHMYCGKAPHPSRLGTHNLLRRAHMVLNAPDCSKPFDDFQSTEAKARFGKAR